MTGVTRVHTVEEAQAIVDYFLGKSYTIIDAARRYGNGSSEEVNPTFLNIIKGAMV